MKKITFAMLCMLLICFFAACGSDSGCDSDSVEELEKVVMRASWAYNYEDIEELTENSDLIAYVSINAMENYEVNGIIKTKYRAEVLHEIYGEKARVVEISMTGGIVDKTVHEIADDPLMAVGDTFLIFARKNTSGTYTILSGPQGRFVVKDNKVSSLNVADPQVAKANQGSNISVRDVDYDLFVSQVESYLGADK